MNDKPFTVATITSGRDDHLRHLIRGVEQSSVLPDEIVVIYMNQPDAPAITSAIPIRLYHISSATLPLAAARNECVRRATNDRIIFLDVDCIPSSTMFEELRTSMAINDSLVMATPFYLYKDIELPGLSDDYLNAHSIPHESRSSIKTGFSSEYTLFWSLCFAVTKKTFERIGGFDTNFTGYGGEDTDFALSAQKAGVKFYVDGARCYHQHHAVYKPPVQHVSDIVINSNYFFEKWRTWPMTGWLEKFTSLGYIQWDKDSDAPIEVKHLPDKDEMESFVDTKNAY